jgi:hypothetical protein
MGMIKSYSNFLPSIFKGSYIFNIGKLRELCGAITPGLKDCSYLTV